MGKRVKFDKGTEARRVARDKAAKPGATRRIEDKRIEDFESCPYCAIRGCEGECQDG